MAQIPAKADSAAQEECLEQKIKPRLAEAEAGKRAVYFVDAAHFVWAVFLGYLWSITRVFVKSPSGRQRYNVLGAISAATLDCVTVTNTGYITATTVVQLMQKILDRTSLPITLVLDNARYQRCKLVMEFAELHKIELLFLPPYSPNLNLIERLWKFVKKKALYNKYYETFASFTGSIDECLTDTATKYKNEISSLMVTNFHIVKNTN